MIQAFPSMALINVMKLNVAIFFPLAIEKISETKISIKRIEVYSDHFATLKSLDAVLDGIFFKMTVSKHFKLVVVFRNFFCSTK